MDSQDNRRLSKAVFQGTLDDAALAQAEAVLAALSQSLEVLAPIIGARGASALYRRSLQLASAAGHPWLAGAMQGVSDVIDTGPLRGLLLGRDAAGIAAAGAALLGTLRHQLNGLVGIPLTDQLLQGVQFPPPSGSGPKSSPLDPSA